MHPQELTETERDIWKKYARKKKGKQPLPQLKMPVCQGQYDLAAFTGMQVTQLFMITAAGKWGLYQGGSRQILSVSGCIGEQHPRWECWAMCFQK